MGLLSIAKDAAFASDLWLLHLVNGSCGSWVFDWIAAFIERTNVFTGGLIMAAYWWVWFHPEAQAERRTKIISGIVAAIIALIVARVISKGLPFRVRPLYAAGIGYRALELPGGPIIGGYEDWSAFPSDHAAMFFALAAGLWRCSRRVGGLAFIFAIAGDAAVRVYLGIHYPSDVLGGAAIGMLCVYAMGRINVEGLARPIMELEGKYPPAFYALAFLVTDELAVVFGDVRDFLHGILRFSHRIGVLSLNLTDAFFLLLGALVLTALTVWLFVGLLISFRRAVNWREKPSRGDGNLIRNLSKFRSGARSDRL